MKKRGGSSEIWNPDYWIDSKPELHIATLLFNQLSSDYILILSDLASPSEGEAKSDQGTMADICYETLQKKDSERCKSIVYLILLPHDLNDSKLYFMTLNDSLCV